MLRIKDLYLELARHNITLTKNHLSLSKQVTSLHEYLRYSNETNDAWIKQLNNNIKKLSEMSNMEIDNADNIQHTYNMIIDLKEEIRRMKEIINSLSREVKLIKISKEEIRWKPEHSG